MGGAYTGGDMSPPYRGAVVFLGACTGGDMSPPYRGAVVFWGACTGASGMPRATGSIGRVPALEIYEERSNSYLPFHCAPFTVLFDGFQGLRHVDAV